MQPTPTSPNILFILVDDLGWKDIGSYGTTFYETPHLDHLRKEGMLFTDAYAACPVCSPTRASFLSGKYPATVQVTNWIGGHANGKLLSTPYLHYLPLKERSLATALKSGGYRTYHVGKWHLGAEPYWPEKQGFDINIGGCHCGRPPAGYYSPYHIPTLKDGPKGEYLTDRLTSEAIKLITTPSDSPFFLCLSYYAVHVPLQAPKELVEKYQRKRKLLGLDKVKEFQKGEHFPTDLKKKLKVNRRLVQSNPTYAAMIESLDWNIGKLLEALDQSHQADNTIVCFTSDNGGLSTAEGSPTCNFPLSEGKGWMYEGGTREPLLIRWPKKISPGSECSTPVSTPDFYPTFLEIAGIAPENGQILDGCSLLPLLQQTKGFPSRDLFWHYPHYGNQGGTPGSSIRSGHYKLIEFFETGKCELYNLKDDIGEEHNLIATHPQIAAEMHQRLKQWREKVEAKIPQPNPTYTSRGLTLKSKIAWLKQEIQSRKNHKLAQQ